MKRRKSKVEEPIKRRRPSPRARLEREVGRKLLTGQIPVLQDIPRCPIPPTHVKDYDEICRAYQEGRLTEAQVIEKVSESLKTLKKPEESKPEGAPA